ncbi:hypothetical protein DXG01_002467 [Tephrocybe rancida]|nr:hypothetical protein DXG01_002467 [Tephrocybe rancida]
MCKSLKRKVSLAISSTKETSGSSNPGAATKKRQLFLPSPDWLFGSTPKGIEDPLPQDDISASSPIEQPQISAQEDDNNALDSSDAPDAPIDDRPIAERRRRRDPRLPERFRDELPQLPLKAGTADTAVSNGGGCLVSRALQLFKTPCNLFGLSKTYLRSQQPLTQYTSDDQATMEDLYDIAIPASSSSISCNADLAHRPALYPYPNESSFQLGSWFWEGGANKSQSSFNDLVKIITNSNFSLEDIRLTKWVEIDRRLGANEFDQESHEWEDCDAGWRRTDIKIDVPFHHRMLDPGIRSRVVGQLYHRPIVQVIKEKLDRRTANPVQARNFHYEPYDLRWKPTTNSDEVPVYGEMFSSPAFQKAHLDLQNSPPEPGCDLPRCVVALMIWSDATHLTSFGNAKLWPTYLFCGNDSKFQRCRPTSKLCQHIAYFQTLPDSFKDFATMFVGGKGPTPAFMAHCRRKAFHAQWDIILDDEFLEAWRHGIVIECCDGIWRRFYPRIFTYSADYPEKILIASIRNQGLCPCPRCLTAKTELSHLGTEVDQENRIALRRIDNEDHRLKMAKATSYIYDSKKQFAINGSVIEKLLKDQSLVAVPILVVNLLHEFELGVWKSVLIHLLRMLYASNAALVNELDFRFRQTPTFGRDTIRKFASNCSELKKLAARDYEDLLQCAIPVFDGLFGDQFDAIIMDILFLAAHWHGLAKLRMHTDYTLNIMDKITTSLGQKMCYFQTGVCPLFSTHELPREAAARIRRESKKTSKEGSGNTFNEGEPETETVTRKLKTLNLDTYKYHALGDYVACIREFGTTDSYSTEPGELEHKTVKARYPRTNKQNFVPQMARHERRNARIHRIRQRGLHNNLYGRVPDGEDNAGPILPELHHVIGKTENSPVNLVDFVNDHVRDPSTEVRTALGRLDNELMYTFQGFISKLKQHMLPRIKSSLASSSAAVANHDTGPSDCDSLWPEVVFRQDRIYEHKIMRINYTTYDVRRAEDIIHVDTPQNNIMVLNPNFHVDAFQDEHPFWYARVLGIYHSNVIYAGEGNKDHQPRRLEFLWVRWYWLNEDSPAGWDALRLDSLSFPPVTEGSSFGFVDPADVIRGCHIIPTFTKGQLNTVTSDLALQAPLGPDWRFYYLNR